MNQSIDLFYHMTGIVTLSGIPAIDSIIVAAIVYLGLARLATADRRTRTGPV